MITFKELYSNLDELKVVNISQRKKMALRMKRMTKSSAFKQKVARSKLKMADPAKLKVKATKLAKKKILRDKMKRMVRFACSMDGIRQIYLDLCN